jgi:crotonobetainyl-CoA:carnitine CoA-transferase CaiB-like acyl-CoA transferase
MLEAQLALMTHAVGISVATGEDPARIGSRHPAVAPFDVFPSRDGYVAIAVIDDRGFRALCDALEMPDLIADARFVDATGRLANVVPLTERIAARTAELSSEPLVELLLEASVPVGPVLGPSDLLADRHLKERGAFARIPDWGDEGLVVPTLPFRLDGQRLVATERAPDLGGWTLDELEEEVGERS